MPSTLEHLARRNAMRAAITDRFVERARNAAQAACRSRQCRTTDGHTGCPGTRRTGGEDAECLCTCHDPAHTSWVWWTLGESSAPIGMCSGPYDTLEEALTRGFADDAAAATWIREHGFVEQVDAERACALEAVLFEWSTIPDAEKARLRPAAAGPTDTPPAG